MKKLAALMLIVLTLTGCTKTRSMLDKAMTLRAELLACQSCTFDATITADYGDKLHTFKMHCVGDNDGVVRFEVTAPDTLAGITGILNGEEGKLTFDDQGVAFSMLADGQVTPVSGPWILMKTLLGGYITACNEEDGLLHLMINDSYADDALELEIWLDGESRPIQTEIGYDGRRILTMEIENFQIQ